MPAPDDGARAVADLAAAVRDETIVLRGYHAKDDRCIEDALAAFAEAADAVLDECGQVGSPALGTCDRYYAARAALAKALEGGSNA